MRRRGKSKERKASRQRGSQGRRNEAAVGGLLFSKVDLNLLLSSRSLETIKEEKGGLARYGCPKKVQKKCGSHNKSKRESTPSEQRLIRGKTKSQPFTIMGGRKQGETKKNRRGKTRGRGPAWTTSLKKQGAK